MSSYSRPLYEEAFSSGDMVRQWTVELDTLVENAQAAVLSDKLTFPQKATQLRYVHGEAQELLTKASRQKSSNFTDFHRIMATSVFVSEKILLPPLFGANTRRIRKFRQELSNGAEGMSVDMISSLLENYDNAPNGLPREERNRIRGAIQEDTLAALLNYRQDGQFIALPSSLYEDTRAGIDLMAYYIAGDGSGYRTPVSVKTTRQDAQQTMERQPNLVVLNAEDLGNLNLGISRLLVKDNEGTPGLTDSEQARLQQARDHAYYQFCEQLPQTVSHPIPHRSSQFLLSLHSVA